MTTPNHILMSALIAYPFVRHDKRKWWIVSACGLLGGLPDLAGWVQGLFEPSLRWNGLYAWLHDIKNIWVHLIPFANIHAWLDYFTHRHYAPYGWHEWAVWLEMGLWVVMIFVSVMYYKSFKAEKELLKLFTE